MKNIMLVANWDSNVGYAWWLMESFWVRIAERYANADCQVYLIFPSISKIPQTIIDSDIITTQIAFNIDTSDSKSALKDFIQKNRIAYVYLSDHPSASILYGYLRFWGVKKIAVHDHTPGDRTAPTGMKKIVKKLIHKFNFISADLYIGATDYITERNILVNQLPKDKCRSAPNGIIPFELKSDYRDIYRKELNIPNDAIVFISTGRANYYKGVDFLLRSVAKLISEPCNVDYYFLHCGDGPNLEEFKLLANELGIGDKFKFLGRRADVMGLLQSCDIAVHAAKGEVGYSLSILEYMSAGLATFVPNRPSVCQSVEHNNTGLIYQAEVEADLVLQIRALVDDPKRLEKLASNAVKEIKLKYNLDNTKKALIKAIEPIFY